MGLQNIYKLQRTPPAAQLITTTQQNIFTAKQQNRRKTCRNDRKKESGVIVTPRTLNATTESCQRQSDRETLRLLFMWSTVCPAWTVRQADNDKRSRVE